MFTPSTSSLYREMANGSIQKNGSELDSLFSSSECIAWLTVYVTESVAIVTLNFVSIIVFIRNRNLRKLSMYLVINLAVADMLVGGFTGVMKLVDIGAWMCSVSRVNGIYSGIWAGIMWGMPALFPCASLINLVAISLERLHATFRPFKHRCIKKWVIRVVITVTWVTVAGLLNVVVVSLLGRRYSLNYHFSVLNVLCSFMSICLFIIFVSYSSILIKVYCGALPRHHCATNRERKLTKTLFIVTLVSLMTWLPFVARIFIWNNTDIFLYLPVVSYERLNYSTVVLLYANSLLNPIVYTIRMPEFRRALVSLFIRRQHKQVHVQIPLRAISL